jgi:NADPH:quinone reductase-like Zn-dependent oxidoreductase
LDGVDVVIDLVGGDVHRAARRILAPFGRVVVAGFASLRLTRWNPLSWWRTWRDLPRADARTLAPDSHGLLATHLGYLLPDSHRLIHVWRDLTAFVGMHEIRPVIGARLPALTAVAEAHRLLSHARASGSWSGSRPRTRWSRARERVPVGAPVIRAGAPSAGPRPCAQPFTCRLPGR